MKKARLPLLLLGVAAKGARRNPPGRRPRMAAAARLAVTGAVWLALAAFGFLAGRMSLDGGPSLIFGLTPYVMLSDFAMRFALQQAPIRLKPFLLLPVSRRTAARCALLASMASSYNLSWMWLFLPYAIAGPAAAGHGFCLSAAIVLTCFMLMAANNLCYIFVSSLASLSSAWWWLPAVAVAGVFAMSLPAGGQSAAAPIVSLCSRYGFTPAAVSAYAAAVIILWRLDTSMLLRLSRDDRSPAPHNRKRRRTLPTAGRHGLTVEYMKMEARSAMRNSTVKRNLFHSLLLTVVFSAATIISPASGNSGWATASWCVYCFLLLPTANLARIMETEGNSFSLLMVHKDSLGQLLKAKYAFSCLTLLLPLAILAPAAACGRLPWLLIAAGMATATGTAHFILFQLAAHNRQAMPADGRDTPKSRRESGRQLAACIAVIAAPALLFAAVCPMAGTTAALSALAATGALLTATSGLWLRAVHRRMVVRKHYLYDGFSQTRQP